MTPTGFEPDSINDCRNRGYGNPAGAGVADLYANQPDFNAIGPELATVVRAWPGLPEATRAGIMAMVKAARVE